MLCEDKSNIYTLGGQNDCIFRCNKYFFTKFAYLKNLSGFRFLGTHGIPKIERIVVIFNEIRGGVLPWPLRTINSLFPKFQENRFFLNAGDN